MNDDIKSPKQRSLESLEWWRVLNSDRDRLVRAAKAAGASQAEIIRASGLHKGTVMSILNKQEAPVPVTTRATHRFAHPHTLRVLGSSDFPKFEFAPFTGLEPRPEIPAEARGGVLPSAEFANLQREYTQAWAAWKTARFTIDARQIINEVKPVWQRFTAARAHMEAVVDEFKTIPDDRWRSQRLKLTEAQEAARKAARKWDWAAQDLLQFEFAHRMDYANHQAADYAPTLKDIAAKLGEDITTWPMAYDPDDYERPAYLDHDDDWLPPFTASVAEGIAETNRRIDAIR